jgi:hypothetical protein
MPAVLTASFQRIPQNHGDLGVWNSPALQQMRRGSLGANSIDVSIGGSLNVDLGFAGISDGVTEGTMQVTAAGTFSLAGSTAGAWHALEFSVSGTSCTFYLTALAGETDESFMSLTMKGYWSAAKLGYYRIASRRVLAFVFIRAGTVLGRIVNTENGIKGFKNIPVENYVSSTGVQSLKYYTKLILEIGDWNMRAAGGGSSLATINYPFPIGVDRIIDIVPVIRPDDDGGSAGFNFNTSRIQDIVDPNLFTFGILYWTNLLVYLERRTGSNLDHANYDKINFNRGFVYITYET